MADFYLDLRDMQFVLNEQIGLEDLLKSDVYSDWEVDDLLVIVESAAKFSKEVLSPIAETGDKEHCQYHPEDGSVTMPAGYKEAYEQFAELGFLGMGYNPEYGGMGVPQVVVMACGDWFVGANTSFDLSTMLTTEAAHLIETFGTDELKKIYLENMYTGKWAGTMCLTEPQAGTDVGAVKTKAIPNGDGTYRIEGQKIFITYGDHDMTENIIHAVLARVEGDAPGTKGISLFVVPKYLSNPDGSIGGFNDVKCAGLEDKMGIHASPTATIVLGEDGHCKGWLLGEQSKGMREMFQMMNAARRAVGLQGEAGANAAYQAALAYAKERLQSPHYTKMKDKTAPKVAIIEHPDVRRLLMLQKSYAEGMRSLLLHVGYFADMARIAQAEDNQEEFDKYNGLVEIMTPVAKAYGSDMGFRVTEWAVQTMGGYGYMSEYAAERYLRDVKIGSIYEGTNGVQALDLVGRKITAKTGANLMTVMAMLNEFIAAHKDHPALTADVARFAAARDALNDVNMYFFTSGQSGEFLAVLLNATPYLELFGDVLTGYYLLDQAVIAHEKLEEICQAKGVDSSRKRKMRKLLTDDRDARFYDGKVKSAKFFANSILPLAPGKADAIRSGDKSAMDWIYDPVE